jgi:RNA polymerase sigma factor (sigma-70 family)
MAVGLEDLFRAHWHLVYGYLARRTGNPSLAEELAQETFYRATRAFLGWRGGSPVAWLLAIARHALIDELRRSGRTEPLPDSLIAPGGSEHEPGIATESLGALPATQRRLLELVYVFGYSHAEIAAITDSTEAAVKTAVWRAREAFRSSHAEQAGMPATGEGEPS